MIDDNFEKYLQEANNKINLFIKNYFKEDNDIQTSLFNLKNLTMFLEQNFIDIAMINVESLILNNQKLATCLNNIVKNINNNIMQQLNNSIYTTLIVSYCKLYNVSNNYVNILIKSINPYDDEAQKELIKRVQNQDKKAKELLIIANDGLVKKYAYLNAYKLRNTSLDAEDLIQVGRLGVIEAAIKFDFTRNVRFSTYALYYIIKNINLEIYHSFKLIRVSKYMYNLICFYNSIENIYLTQYGYAPSEEDFAREMQLPIKKIREIVHNKNSVLSLDKVLFNMEEDTECRLIDFIVDSKQDFEEDAIFNIQLEEFKTKLEETDKIKERDKIIIKLRYGIDDQIIRTYDDIANLFHIKKESIRQIINKNLTKIGYDKYLYPLNSEESLKRSKNNN